MREITPRRSAGASRTGGTPDVTATRRNGTLKYGFGMNMEQELTKDIGVFARLGWNDGKTESFAFTAIDRLATGGVSITGQRWRRPLDTVATELTVGGISGVHALYLARGGHDFLIGDGHLQYGPEYVVGELLQRAAIPWILRQLRSPARRQSGLQSTARTRLDFLRPAPCRAWKKYLQPTRQTLSHSSVPWSIAAANVK